MGVRGKLVELLAEFYGCDPMYYGVDALVIAQHLTANGVAPVVHGHWNYCCPTDGNSYRYCSICSSIVYDSVPYIPKYYCPACGAKMESESE